MEESLTKKQRPVYGTFGVYRYLLAVMVIITHTAPEKWRFFGETATYAFFILSGYAISFVLYHTYLRKPHGIWRFALNRSLRIYPLYWLACIISETALACFPQAAYDLNPMIGLPESLLIWLATMSTLFILNRLSGTMIHPALLPVGWSLGVEITYWALLPILLLKKWARKGLLCFAVVYTLLAFWEALLKANVEMAQSFRYFSTLAASLPFCIGLMLFMRKQGKHFVIPNKAGIAILCATGVLLVAAPFVLSDPRFVGLYFFLAMNALIIAYLSQIDTNKMPSLFKKIDTYCGNLSYPMYLIHLPVAVLLHGKFALLCHSGLFCISTIGAASIAAAVLHQLVEVPISHVRDAIKS